MRSWILLRGIGLLCVLAALALPAAGGEWSSGDVEAARRYQDLERERARRYRASLDTEARAEAQRRVPEPRRQQRAERTPVPAPAPEEPGFVARIARELGGSLRDWAGHLAAELAAEFEPWARELARDLLGSAQRALVVAWCEASADESCSRA